jgi:hypothetical protein
MNKVKDFGLSGAFFVQGERNSIMEIDIVETGIREKDSEIPNRCNYVGQRKAVDVFKDLKEYLGQRNMLPEDYFLINVHLEDKDVLFPRNANIIAYADYGGNEGIYLDVELMQNGKLTPFARGKTLSETKEGLVHMYLICAEIIQAFHGDTNVHSRYLIVPN